MSGTKIQEGNIQISKTLLQNLYAQRVDKSFCDVKLTVEDNEIWCHACVLASSSSYFKELLQTNCPRGSHWCFRNPLEINICQEFKHKVEICTVCVVKIIDSMYLKELVVVKEHLEHFSKIVEFFKVIDLLPLCVKYSNYGTEVVTSDLFDTLTKAKPVNVKKTCRETSKLSLDSGKLKKVQPESRFLKEKESENPNSSLEKATSPVVKSLTASKSEISADHNYVIKEPVKNQNCEFVCCNSLVTSVPAEGELQSGKRVLRCEVCPVSTVFARKMLKHIEHSQHFGNICAVCYWKFSDMDLARAHLKEHLDEKPYFCHICKKRDRNWENHKLHYKVHCKNKEFKCTVCEKSFRLKKYLNEHKKSHEVFSGENEAVICKEKDVKSCSKLKDKSDTNGSNKSVYANTKLWKKFHCQVCNEGFTRKKNLMRHSTLKHLTNDHLQCSGCNYQTQRSDLLKHHMKKYHKELVVEKALKPKLKKKNKSSIVGVMIPVQLVSTEDSSAISGYVVEKNEEATKKLQNDQNYLCGETNAPNLIYSTSFQSDQSESRTLYTDNNTSNPEIKNPDSKMKTITNNDGVIDTLAKCSNEDFERIKTNSLSGIWLNEATGELLDDNTFLNVHLVDSSRIETNFQAASTSENSLALILNEMSNGLPLLDFADDTDNFQSNPQTPQTTVVEIEDADNLFSWNYLEANFCSTWVLNEATGELNMVSFNMQSFKDSESLQLDKNTTRASADDDDTALFLNEGTGDLSVIYFNPNKCDQTIPDHPSEQINQEDQDNMSEHSNDDKDDLLNEEFLLASANFMAYEENETFLNELTGEFNTTALGQYQSRKEENKPENMYLNEETGEISWNVLDKNIGRDFFTNHENLNFDESLNYEDFDLAEDINDFQFQSFGLDTNISSDWPEEPCGTLLNECTGEFVTKD